MKNNQEHSGKTSARQGAETVIPEPLKIGAGTPYNFSAQNLTAYGGLLPVATMLEKLGFQQLVEETLSIGRQTRVMPVYRFVLALVLALYVGFSRLNHLRFLQREPMLAGILACCGSRRSVPSGGSWPLCTAVWPANCWRCSGACGSEYGKQPT